MSRIKKKTVVSREFINGMRSKGWVILGTFQNEIGFPQRKWYHKELAGIYTTNEAVLKQGQIDREQGGGDSNTKEAKTVSDKCGSLTDPSVPA